MREDLEMDPDEDPPQPVGNHGNNGDNNLPDEGLELNPEDLVEVVGLNNAPPEPDLADEVGDMDLENYDDGFSDDDEGMVEGAEGGSPPREDAQIVFSSHTGSVFCVAIDRKDGMLAVSGGEDDRAFVWQTHNGNKLMECKGHKDSVSSVGFSHDGAYVATGDMAGLIKVWKVATQQEVWSFEVSDLEWLEWHHSTAVLMAGTSEGDVWMWKIPSGDTKTFESHGCACNIGKIMPDGKRACTGYEDGAVKVWDLKAGTVIHSFTGHNCHSSSIISMDCHPENTLVLTGSTDISAKLLNTSSGKVVATFNCESAMQTGEEDDSVEAVGFSKIMALAGTGTLNGMLTFWDIPTNTARHHCKHETGIVRLRWDNAAPLAYTCTLDGAVHLWDARTGKRESQWFGHNASVLDMDMARNNSLIVTASEDKTARVFSLQHPDR